MNSPPPTRSILACLAAFALGLPSVFAQTTERVSVDSGGLQGNDDSWVSSISSDGRFVAFDSRANNLVPGDTNGWPDIFVHNRQTGQTTRVSVDSGGIQGNGWSFDPNLSSDGRFVTFGSAASNLVAGDTNGVADIFVHDRQTGQTTRVSVASGGIQGNNGSFRHAISADGRFVAIASDASNLVLGDTNNYEDVFIHDRQTGQTTRMSVDSGGIQGNNASDFPGISSDGRYVGFVSSASNLVPSDSNNVADVFVHDRQTGQTTRVSVDSGGIQGNGSPVNLIGPRFSSDGRFVAFDSDATNHVPGDSNDSYDVFVHDRQTGQTTRVSVNSRGGQGNSASYVSSISSDGRFVAFESYASNLVPGGSFVGSDIFVHDRRTGQTTQVSLNSTGIKGNGQSNWAIISSDVRFVAFQSSATNLVLGDTNNYIDIFVRDRGPLGPSIGLSGTCPGSVTLTISDTTANGSVAIVYGPAGVFVKPTPPCQGLTLGVAPPTLAAMRIANGAGIATQNFTAPPGACGLSVQAVDVTTCTATNVIVL